MNPIYAHPYDQLQEAERIERFGINWARPVSNPRVFPRVFLARYTTLDNMRVSVHAHVYHPHEEHEARYWVTIAVTALNYHSNFLGVLACGRVVRNNIPTLVLFSERWNTSLANWIATFPNDILRYSHAPAFKSYSPMLKKFLREVLSGIVELLIAGRVHGDVRAENVFLVDLDVVGNHRNLKAKLGRFKGINPQGSDITDFISMLPSITNVDQLTHTVTTVYPSDHEYFIGSFKLLPSEEWYSGIIYHSPKHPLFMEEGKDRVMFWHDSVLKVDEVRRNYGGQQSAEYQDLTLRMSQRLAVHGIFYTDWKTNVQSSNNTAAINCYNHNPTTVWYLSVDDPFSFLVYGRNFGEHHNYIGYPQVHRFLDSVYSGYMCVVHEVLAGLGWL